MREIRTSGLRRGEPACGFLYSTVPASLREKNTPVTFLENYLVVEYLRLGLVAFIAGKAGPQLVVQKVASVD